MIVVQHSEFQLKTRSLFPGNAFLLGPPISRLKFKGQLLSLPDRAQGNQSKTSEPHRLEAHTVCNMNGLFTW